MKIILYEINRRILERTGYFLPYSTLFTFCAKRVAIGDKLATNISISNLIRLVIFFKQIRELVLLYVMGRLEPHDINFYKSMN